MLLCVLEKNRTALKVTKFEKNVVHKKIHEVS